MNTLRYYLCRAGVRLALAVADKTDERADLAFLRGEEAVAVSWDALTEAIDRLARTLAEGAFAFASAAYVRRSGWGYRFAAFNGGTLAPEWAEDNDLAAWRRYMARTDAVRLDIGSDE